jgi:hypothetical protein
MRSNSGNSQSLEKGSDPYPGGNGLHCACIEYTRPREGWHLTPPRSKMPSCHLAAICGWGLPTFLAASEQTAETCGVFREPKNLTEIDQFFRLERSSRLCSLATTYSCHGLCGDHDQRDAVGVEHPARHRASLAKTAASAFPGPGGQTPFSDPFFGQTLRKQIPRCPELVGAFPGKATYQRIASVRATAAAPTPAAVSTSANSPR